MIISMKVSQTKAVSISELKKVATEIRKNIIRMTAEAKSGHPGGSLSATEVVVALYFQVMRHDPKNPGWADRDRFIMSKGHASPVLYAALAHSGYFPAKDLINFRKLESPLQGHPDRRRLPGVEASTGSLGQGLSIGIGMALARRLQKKDYRTFVVMSDGEMNEGQTWEGAAFAAFQKLDHLTLIVDFNKYQLSDATAQILNMESLAEKWKSFNWDVQEIDGHDLEAVLKALERAKQVKGKPAVIIAHTVKGKGISFMENNNHFHGVAPTAEEAERALKELEGK
ncbi:MAG: transketolase [Candidatus Omnitrophica bacterium CG11_big_fil_rev_8_21_14_0_20_45_26]|uniref:Transketolase n=1 Tax=Candidatus Abzuiibacterium crystallinum TaxID=1974748 RepID=A0A2H0LQD8_9BACT|nr:MAG: transketolase [Candidatus Omnitrophica bacterium CG11_big_fil_rev_8_21_14_0_20_45_26]PIW65439.1 MAG: transketolase [Candidatus Omnitrophica bacterium CG12_big_fil_rev_8_21_14_0_65_45_16]